ncbi:hypothetical protein D621_03360 [beta proteobacterium AAP51]|nr:hypothetical protein D621_03360 [beta proteobacterium AAP51]
MSAPLSHHAILALLPPFTAAGWSVDLAASDRAARRLAFKPAVHEAGATHPALTETRELQDGPRGWQLTRRFSAARGVAGVSDADGDTPTALTAEVMAEGGEPPELLAAAAALTPGQLFTREGAALALRCTPGQPGQLRAAVARVAGLELRCTVSGVKGYPAEIMLTRDEGDTRRLPDDLLEVLGRGWSRLVPVRTGWQTSMMLQGAGAERSADAQQRLAQTLAHLAQVLAEPPLRFHQRFRLRRWRIGLLRGVPLALGVALVGVAYSLRDTGGRAEALLGALANIAPPLLMAMFFLRREMPRIELPRLPRCPRPTSWQPWRP